MFYIAEKDKIENYKHNNKNNKCTLMNTFYAFRLTQ
jgi:hypothetical protein